MTVPGTVFGLFRGLQPISDSDVLVWLVPLLALLQITHYLLDAVIWRMSLPGTPWKRIMFPVATQDVIDPPGDVPKVRILQSF